MECPLVIQRDAVLFLNRYRGSDLVVAAVLVRDNCVQLILPAAEVDHQTFIAAFVDGQFAGFIIAAVHAPGDRELDWMMVDPDFHGGGVAAALMEAAIEWLDEGQPQWLNVIQHNHRAVHFYRKFGFEIDPEAATDHVIPHHIMRRPGKAD